MNAPKCHYDAERGWLTPEHLSDCDDHDCQGCRPCGKTHCAMKGRCANHVDAGAGLFTCPSCIGRTRKQLALIVEHYTVAMPAEALVAGVESEAFNLIGPAASADQTTARRMYLDAERGWCDYPPTIDDPHHPYVVFGHWDLALRETYGPQTDLFITVTSAADYLASLLAGEFPHTREFEEFARDIARCLRHLDDVAHDSRDPEKGAPCPKCAEADEKGKGPRLLKRYGAATDGSGDTWHCPANPAHWWSDEDYRLRVDGDYVKHADELPATELCDRIGVPLSTFRKWTARTWNFETEDWNKPRLESRRKAADGRKLYSVKEALRLAESLAA